MSQNSGAVFAVISGGQASRVRLRPGLWRVGSDAAADVIVALPPGCPNIWLHIGVDGSGFSFVPDRTGGVSSTLELPGNLVFALEPDAASVQPVLRADSGKSLGRSVLMMLAGVLGVASVVAATWQSTIGSAGGGAHAGADLEAGAPLSAPVVVPRIQGLVAEPGAGASMVLRGVLANVDDCNTLRQWLLLQQGSAGVSNHTVCMPALLADANELLQGTTLALASTDSGRVVLRGVPQYDAELAKAESAVQFLRQFVEVDVDALHQRAWSDAERAQLEKIKRQVVQMIGGRNAHVLMADGVRVFPGGELGGGMRLELEQGEFFVWLAGRRATLS